MVVSPSLVPDAMRRETLLRSAGTHIRLWAPDRQRTAHALRGVRGTKCPYYPNTVLPLRITTASRAFTRASKEITLPSFHRSSVTVSPG